ncbi:hypothetical protein ABTM50_20430, partial [Acinetobacter baumannii]
LHSEKFYESITRAELVTNMGVTLIFEAFLRLALPSKPDLVLVDVRRATRLEMAREQDINPRNIFQFQKLKREGTGWLPLVAK